MTLDEVWADAEVLGRPSVERAHGEKPKYTATIHFNTKGGSYISAKGESAISPTEALSTALGEARALRAGYEFAAA